MAIIRYDSNSIDFREPKEETRLARYLDLTKFLFLLKYKQVFFCRLDKLEDKFEGTMPRATHTEITRNFKEIGGKGSHSVSISDKEISQNATEYLKYLEKFKSLNCVNCWNEFESESYALWKIYSNLNQGIMLQTNFTKVIKSFSESTENIYCSRVKYIDYEKDSIDFGNVLSPSFHKHKAYAYEKEIRLIHDVKADEKWEHDWISEPNSNGIMIPVDLSQLIEQVVISPYAPNWFKPIIEDLMIKYEINCGLVDSSLK